MAGYEYWCLDCEAHVNVVLLAPLRPDGRCDACQSTRIVHMVPGVTTVKEAADWGQPTEQAERGGDRDDPSSGG